MPIKLTERQALRGMNAAKFAASHARVAKDAAYLEKVRDQYTSKYPKKWIAVYGQKVVGPTDSSESIVTLLREQAIDPSEAVVGYLDPNHNQAMIL